MAGSAFLLTPLPHSNSRPPHHLLPTSLAAPSVTAYSSRPFFRSPPRLCCLAEYGDARRGVDASQSLLTDKPWARSGGDVKVPTAPWMRGPLLLPADDVLDLSKPRTAKKKGKPGGGSLTRKVRGGRSRQAMKKIVTSIAQLGEISHLDDDDDDDDDDEEEEEEEEEKGMGDVMNFPIEQVLGSKEEEVVGEGSLSRKMPWVGTDKPMVFPRMKKPRAVTTAELVLPGELLMRLRMEARNLTKWVKAKKAGVTDDVVDEIMATWRRNDLAMVKFVEPLCRNMDRAREIVERLTGGVLILRNKFFIILYRGKDFIPPKVANSIFDRERQLKDMQLQEEEAREKATETFLYTDATTPPTNGTGTFIEFCDFKTNYESFRNGSWEIKVKIEAEKERLEKELRNQQQKLQLVKLKIDKSEMELAKLKSKLRPSEHAADQEFLTEEERQTYRRIGLRMDEFLQLGRRGVYDGTIGSIHMHWKHREVVKVITMQQKFSQITFTACLLEMESNGILVTIEKLKRGYAIILYRGKNYRAPIELLPENLLTKKEALGRSIEIQRRGSLRYFAYKGQQSVWELKVKLRALEKKLEDLNCQESLSKL